MKRSRSQANITVSAGPPVKRKRSTKITRYPRNGIAETARVRLTYAEEVPLTTTGLATVQRYQFAVNNLFDPNLTGTGLQPAGFDEWMTLYQYYTVMGGKIKVTPITGSTSAHPSGYFSFAVSDSQILSGGSIQSMLTAASGGSRNKGQPFSGIGINFGAFTAGTPGLSRSVTWKTSDIMGMKPGTEMAKSTLQGASGSGPSDIIYGTLFYGDCVASAGVTSHTGYHLVELDFDVIFSGPKQLLMS